MKKYHKIQKSREKQNGFSTVFFKPTRQQDNKSTRQQVNKPTRQQDNEVNYRRVAMNTEDKRSLKTYNPTSSTINY